MTFTVEERRKMERKIHQVYGPDNCKASLSECAKYLRSIGYNSLADFLESGEDTKGE